MRKNFSFLRRNDPAEARRHRAALPSCAAGFPAYRRWRCRSLSSEHSGHRAHFWRYLHLTLVEHAAAAVEDQPVMAKDLPETLVPEESSISIFLPVYSLEPAGELDRCRCRRTACGGCSLPKSGRVSPSSSVSMAAAPLTAGRSVPL